MSDTSRPPQPGGSQDVFFGAGQAVPLPLIERAKGIYLWDEEGNEYLDASSGPLVSCLGHCNEAVLAAMREQAGRLDYAFTRLARNRANLEYARRLATIAGPGFERVSLSSGGSEAMESAVRFLRTHAVKTGRASRRRIITLMPSYHGATIAAAGMSGDPTQELLLEDFATVSHKAPAPRSYRLPDGHTASSYAAFCAERLERLIIELGPETVLAVIIEPVGGLSTGAVVPPATYFRTIRDNCTRHGVHLVFDEVLSGVARTGRFLAAHHWPEALPDVVVLAKGLAGGYSPLGAFLAPASLVDELAQLGGYETSFSYNANPISAAAGRAVLEEIERLDLTARATVAGVRLRGGLEAIAVGSAIVGDVRGLGMMLAVEIVADKRRKTSFPAVAAVTERVRVHGLGRGLMLYSRRTAGGRDGDWFMVAPPLTIDDAECDVLLERVEATLRDLEQELASGTVPAPAPDH